jgi:hypothetical protein
MSEALVVQETPIAETVANMVAGEENVSFESRLNLAPVFAAGKLRLSLTEGNQRIGVTIFGKRGSVGISLKEVEKAKRYAVQVSPHHAYGNAFPSFPYFVPRTELDAMNLITRVAIAIYEADQCPK